MDQGELFDAKMKGKSRGRWTDDVLEKAIVKVLREGLVALGVPHNEIRARLPCRHCSKPSRPAFHESPSEPGIPDLIGWIPPRMSPTDRPIPLYIEVKRPAGGVESEVQKQFIERASRDGVIAIFARGWDEMCDALRSAGVKIPDGV